MNGDDVKLNALDASEPEVTVEIAIERAKRAFALSKYEESVEHYATALELATTEHGDDSPEIADLYFAYGKALLENAIAQSSVLGKDQAAEEADAPAESKASGSGISGNGPVLSFSGDAEDVEADEPVDLFAQAAEDVAAADAAEAAEEEDEEGEDVEPEDDFNAAWEVLDLARAIYDKQHLVDEDNEGVKMKLADTYIALGDVSLETEKFDQAISDYEVGLALKVKLLPNSSRQIAEAHYKLSIVLDLTSGRLADAITHAQMALDSVESRLNEIKTRLAEGGSATGASVDEKKDVKGKGKAAAGGSARDSLIQNMTVAQMEAEVKELGELREDLALKVEELKTSPSEMEGTAPALAAQALDKALNAGSSSSVTAQTPVNDLTSMVVKKKKKAPAAEEGSSSKRKAEEEPSGSPGEKKLKLETEAEAVASSSAP
ncbi:hypothetical protein HGRIS_004164 [Hohenbuehelia grisea]|uniref:Tetratricopeptide SHNi-TPR domain-containing protein n=1 Tax=Hohenbuehelia grisea TaxID=104357 RepID=A0ABR3JHP7_9AGAR